MHHGKYIISLVTRCQHTSCCVFQLNITSCPCHAPGTASIQEVGNKSHTHTHTHHLHVTHTLHPKDRQTSPSSPPPFEEQFINVSLFCFASPSSWTRLYKNIHWLITRWMCLPLADINTHSSHTYFIIDYIFYFILYVLCVMVLIHTKTTNWQISTANQRNPIKITIL